MDQNSALKKEAGIAERKLLARNERIQNLEALLQDADRRLAVQNQKFEAQLQAVKERLEQARGSFPLFTHQCRFPESFLGVCSTKGRFIPFELWANCEAFARWWRGQRIRCQYQPQLILCELRIRKSPCAVTERRRVSPRFYASTGTADLSLR